MKNFLISILVPILLFSCTKGQSPEEKTTDVPTSTPGQPNIVTVMQKDKKFSVTKMSLRLGDTIVFKNVEADITHNVYSITPGNEFEIKWQKPQTETPLFLDPKKFSKGKMTVECAIHPNMKLVLEIQ